MKTYLFKLVCVLVLAATIFQAQTARGGMEFTPEQGQVQAMDYQASDMENINAVLEDAMAISAGDFHTCVLTRSGGVKCWGVNSAGQLGDGTTTIRYTPVDVAGLASGVLAIKAGELHTCALTSSGGVKCWGWNNYGQLGDGTTTDRLTPVVVVGLESGVTAIEAGAEHTCALTSSGGAKCWGYNWFGQLGNGTTTTRLTPVNVADLASGVFAISAGHDHTCALTTSGGAMCWGWNKHGQLGDGTTTTRLTPVDVASLASGASAITAGGSHTCALTSSGGVKCWGWNNYGQLGDGTTTNRLTSVDVAGLAGGVTAIEAGEWHTCTLTSSGGAKCWGNNNRGQLGDGTTTTRIIPVYVADLASGVLAISAGHDHTCALTPRGGARCWGDNHYGQLGDGTTPFSLTPVYVAGLASGAAAITTGGSHTCALTSSGEVKCWGDNNRGQLGDGTITTRITPVDVAGLSGGAAAIQAGRYHTCALTGSDEVKCWGENWTGQLGDGTTTDRLTPVYVVGLASGAAVISAATISAGFDHTCAVTSTGGVKCWGYNFYGQLGDGTTTPRLTPVDVTGLTSGVAAVEAGGLHTCALTSSGGVKCWGSNGIDQLGDGTTTDRLIPVDVSGLASGVLAIEAGDWHTCALTSTGEVRCWGDNKKGQLGDGTTTSPLTPVDVAALANGAAAVEAGGYHTCALTSSGGVKCWGMNIYGQLGDGTTTTRLTPVDVAGLASEAAVVSLGGYHSCALIISSGGLMCWGDNWDGQLGDGTGPFRMAPVDVVGLGGGSAGNIQKITLPLQIK